MIKYKLELEFGDGRKYCEEKTVDKEEFEMLKASLYNLGDVHTLVLGDDKKADILPKGLLQTAIAHIEAEEI